MAVKRVSIRIEEEILEKLGHIADDEGRSGNSRMLILVRQAIGLFEQDHGPIRGEIAPAVKVKPARKHQP
ncbi:MAG: Arc family DNA-binding protein [Ruminococcaceae bacterium]|nr:Arc family DNA-binding protein [Oscillospiraceae bacterium]